MQEGEVSLKKLTSNLEPIQKQSLNAIGIIPNFAKSSVAGAGSPSMAIDPLRLQQIHQYMQHAHAFFPGAFGPPGASKLGNDNTEDNDHGSSQSKAESSRREGPPQRSVVSSSVPSTDFRRQEKVKKEPAQTSTGDDDDDDEGKLA